MNPAPPVTKARIRAKPTLATVPADPITVLHSQLAEGIAEVGAGPDPGVSLERPKKAELGDYSTNAALLLTPVLGETPAVIAGRLKGALESRLGDDLEAAEVAGPGFVNLVMSNSWHRKAVATILSQPDFGSGSEASEKIQLEYVSANPTGPLTAAGGRGAAYGDSLAKILAKRGHSVEREYYLNDAGTQVRSFAASIAARMRGEEPPEDGYAGSYIAELAGELASAGVSPDDLTAVALRGTEAMRLRIKATLERFGARFDTWSSERELLEKGALEETLAELEAAGHTYRAGGAVWLRTSDGGDDKDRVLVRSDGEPTYFATDIAYHRDKLRRGAEHMIVPLGADHHGYVPRMKAAVGMLSGDPERYEAPIMQLVNIVEGGERTRMSKRRGEFVTLDELIDDIGTDAARFFLLQHSHDTVIDLDLELARSKSQDNPVFYVQYAHARISSILERAAQERLGADDVNLLAVPCERSERILVRRLLEFPGEVEIAAERRAPHRICAYATAVARDFHSFYRDCRVIGADAERGTPGLEEARLALCEAARRVIAGSLDLVGVGAPDAM